jgi:DNA-binding NarL/FixJ family response regulator
MNEPDRIINVAVVEDDERLRGSLVDLLERTRGVRCVNACETGEEALAANIERVSDVILMDINLPGKSGIECTTELKRRRPEVQIMVLTVYENAEKVFLALKAGATGYLLKRTPPAELVAAIRELYEGGSPMSGSIARKVVALLAKPSDAPTGADTAAGLTPREREILEALSQGLQNKEIASEYGVSITTVRTHLRKIYEKLHVQNRTEAARKWLVAPK